MSSGLFRCAESSDKGLLKVLFFWAEKWQMGKVLEGRVRIVHVLGSFYFWESRRETPGVTRPGFSKDPTLCVSFVFRICNNPLLFRILCIIVNF